MSGMRRPPEGIEKAIRMFQNLAECESLVRKARWPDGRIRCPACGSARVIYLANAELWKCYGKHPGAKFSLKSGTLFEKSPLGLDKWLAVMWLLVNGGNRATSWEIHRRLGISQKTAWKMLERGRQALEAHLLSDEEGLGEIGGTRRRHPSEFAGWDWREKKDAGVAEGAEALQRFRKAMRAMMAVPHEVIRSRMEARWKEFERDDFYKRGRKTARH